VVDIVFGSLCFIALIAAVYFARELSTGFGAYLIGSYIARIVIHFVSTNVQFFHHEIAGDARIYEWLATWIATQWEISGVQYMTAHENPHIGPTDLPPNIFAIFIYLAGGQSARIACTSLVVLITCLTALYLHRLAIELGAARRTASGVTMVLFGMPGVLYYSSDMYKDPLVLGFTVAAVGSAIRVSRKFSLLHAGIGVVALLALWHVRFYMVFLAILPIVVGYMGFGSGSWLRPAISAVLVGVALWALAGSQGGAEASSTVEATFDFATGRKGDTGVGNAYGGSAVELDKGVGSIPIRVIYTLFSPFPWQGGTIGLHLGKVDALILTFLIYRAVRATKLLAKVDRATLLSLLAYIMPTTLAYSLTMANIGLMLRQRIPVVVMIGLLAMFSWPLATRRATAKPTKGRGAGAPRLGPRRFPRPPAQPAA
jgi:hypothetical protein